MSNTEKIDICDFIARIEPEPHHDKPGLMRAFDEFVAGPVDYIHMERMSDDLYWMVITKGDQRQRFVIGSASGKAKVIARTEID